MAWVSRTKKKTRIIESNLQSLPDMNLLTAFPVTLATFSPMDMGIIFLVLLIFFGAKKLPEFARSMGQAVREFSKAKDDFEREISRPPETPRQHSLEHSSDCLLYTSDAADERSS